MTDSPIAVIHVDDDREFTRLVGNYFDQHHDDITVHTARDGDDALALLKQTDDIDCVVSDYEMPGGDGLDLLKTVRQRWPDLPFILFTGKGSESIAEKAITAGVTDYVQKHPDTSTYSLLANRIRNAVAQHRSTATFKRGSRWTEAQFKLLVDSVEDYAIFGLDPDGHIRTWNRGAEKIKGYTSDEIIGKHFSVFYRDSDVEAGVPDRNLRRAASEGRTTDEGWRVRQDGSEFWAHITITAIREGGELVGYVKVTHDSTDRHHKAVLLEQNQQLRNLIASMAHDLRNPLVVANGNIELAIESEDLSYLDTVRQAHERVDELLTDLETLAMEERQITEPEPVALREVIETAWNCVETAEADLTVEGDATVLVDRQRLQQVLENLIVNAVEHAGPDVSVRIGPLNEGGLYVEDDGPGIPEGERDKIFEMGYTSATDGSGFGLAICQQIASAHGWIIKVRAGSDGGARFEVSNMEMA